MFYINDEKVNFSGEQTNEIAKQIIAEKKRLEPLLRKGMRLNWRRGTMSINPLQKLKEGKKGAFTPFKVLINNSQGSNLVVFCDTAQKDAVGNISYRPKGEWFNGALVLSLNDIEKAIYYSLFCPYVKNGVIVIENKEAEAKDIEDARTNMAKYMYYLYNETSPIYDDHAKLTEIAKAFGIPNTADMSIGVLRNAIYDAITMREAVSKDGIKFFENIVGGTDKMLKPLADVQTLMDANEIYIDNRDFSWKFTKSSMKFMALNPTDTINTQSAKTRLANHLLANKEAQETVDAIIKGLDKGEVTVTSAEELECMEWQGITNLCKKYEVKFTRRPREQVILELQQKMKL